MCERDQVSKPTSDAVARSPATADVVITSLAATPVQYRFVSVHRIVGFSELQAAATLPIVSDLPINMGIEGISAVLTMEPNARLAEIDRTTAIAHLMLLGFGGQRAPGDVLDLIAEKVKEYADERLKRFGPLGVYLVLEARGTVVTTPTDVARDLGSALVAFDAVDKKDIMTSHKTVVSTAVTATVLAVDATVDVAQVLEGVALTLPDGRPLHSITMTAGNVSLTTARPAMEKDVIAIERAVSVLLRNPRLNSPSRLLVDALLQSTADRLEAFILAWAALEMTIRKCTVGCETGEWLNSLRESEKTTAAAIHQAYIEGAHQNYSLAQKADVFALKYEIEPNDNLASEVSKIRKSYREPLYHEGSIAHQFPVETIVALTKKLIDAFVKS